jgi:hypothetical protein
MTKATKCKLCDLWYLSGSRNEIWNHINGNMHSRFERETSKGVMRRHKINSGMGRILFTPSSPSDYKFATASVCTDRGEYWDISELEELMVFLGDCAYIEGSTLYIRPTINAVSRNEDDKIRLEKRVAELEVQTERLASKNREMEDEIEESWKEVDRLEEKCLDYARELDETKSRERILEVINKSLAESLLKGKICLVKGVKSISIEFEEETY